jgi:hypothetical protein
VQHGSMAPVPVCLPACLLASTSTAATGNTDRRHVDVPTNLNRRCIDALRQLETPEGWAHPAVGLLALQAFLATGDAQQAETEAAGGVQGRSCHVLGSAVPPSR